MKKGNFGKAVRTALLSVTVFVAAVFVFAGCEQSTSGGRSSEKGTVTVFIDFDESMTDRQESVVPGLLRTVYPGSINTDGTLTKFEASFTPSGSGTPVTAVGPEGSTSVTVTVAVGTYTITITAFTGTDPSYTAVAVGTVENVTIAKSGNADVNVLMRPKTGSGVAAGILSYDITVPSGVDSATLLVSETIGGTAITGGSVTLTAGTQNKSTLSIPPGYYWLTVYLTKGSESAGLGPEALHIYSGLTSALPAVTYTNEDFVALSAVSALDLTQLIVMPAVDQTPGAQVTGTQYVGSITWSPTVTGTFVGGQVYTATVTLTAKAGYTFTGVAANAFTYTSSTSVANAAGSGTVTIVFPATGPSMGSQKASAVFDYAEIPVNGYTDGGVTVTKGVTPHTALTVTGSDYGNISWYVDGNPAAKGTGSSFTIDPDDFTVKTHTLTVIAVKSGIPYSRKLSFTVEEEKKAGGENSTPILTVTKSSIADDVTAWLEGDPAPAKNDSATPYIIKLDGTNGEWPISGGEFQNYDTIYNALKDVKDYYFTIDMSDVAVTLIKGTGGTATATKFTKLNTAAIVGVILPKTLSSLATNTFFGMTYLKYMEFPATVTVLVDPDFFFNAGVTTFVVRGENVSFSSDSYLGAGFFNVYNSPANVRKAGIYTGTLRSATPWVKTAL
jgi:hypothetical protein